MARNTQQQPPARGALVPTQRQRMLMECPADTIFFGGARGGGKAQPLDANVLTPYGWRRMGDLEVGDTVTGADGRPQKVIGVYDQGEQDIYEIAFIDGAKAQCTLDHLWNIKETCTRAGRKKPSEGWRVTSFGMIKDFLDRRAAAPEGSALKSRNILVPLCSPVRYTKAYRDGGLPVPPYELGAILGNGCLREGAGKAHFYTPSRDVAERVSSFHKWERVTAPSALSTTSGGGEFYTLVTHDRGLMDALAKLGLAGSKPETKFIPERYLYASVEDRLELARGLLDTDGYADKRGHVVYTTVSRELAEGVRTLIWSLGGKATLTSGGRAHYTDADGRRVECREAFDVYINTKDNPSLFTDAAKKARCRTVFNGGAGELCRRVSGYSYVGRKPARCIAVSNPDSLYITDGFTVTHNTYGIGLLLLHRCSKYGGTFKALFVRRTNPELEDAIGKFRGIFGPAATWVSSQNLFKFWNGAEVRMGYIEAEDDATRYQGKEYALIVFDEATNFRNYRIIQTMRGCLRSPDIPTQLILSGNPGGPMHMRLKTEFIDPWPAGDVLIPDGVSEETGKPITKCFIPSLLTDNPYLAKTNYADNLRRLGTPEQVEQWLHGNWNVAVNAAFSDLFDLDIHTLKPFPIPWTWSISKGYDFGSSHPWGCVWYAFSDGSDFIDSSGAKRHTIPGDMFGVYELYGWNGTPNVGDKASIEQQAYKIKLVEETTFRSREIYESIADNAIFTRQSQTNSIADEFEDNGVFWEPCEKFPGSRRQEFILMRERLLASIERRDKPGIYWTTRCQNCIRTIPMLQMDHKDQDAVETGNSSEDHLYDLTGYLLTTHSDGRVVSGASMNY